MIKVLKKGMVLVMCIALMTQSVLAEEEVMEAVEAEVVEDNPSIWAAWEVQMAEAYGLGEEMSYVQYQSDSLGKDLLAIEASLEAKFGVVDDEKVMETDVLTRGTVIAELYDIIEKTLSLSTDESKENTEIDYFVNNGMIVGRSMGEYALEEICSKEEMILFVKRTYDHLMYQLDQDAKGVFWEVSDEDNTVYLLGSVHVSDGSIFPINDKAILAFYQSDALVVEANILASNPEDTVYIQEKIMLEDEETIEQLLSEEVYVSYVEAFEELGVLPEVYNKLKPWYGAMLLQNMIMAEDGYDASMGIDVFFLSLAYGIGTPVIELEGVKYQIDMFDSFSKELQEVYISGILGDEEENDETESLATIENIMKYWKSGDVEKFEEMLFSTEGETEEEIEFNEKVYEIRNADMLEQVEAMLVQDSEHDYFVVVGAGHMLGDIGIVAKLRELGYSVNQVK